MKQHVISQLSYQLKKSTDINNISAHFTDNGYSENSVSIEVNVGGTIYPLSYTL